MEPGYTIRIARASHRVQRLISLSVINAIDAQPGAVPDPGQPTPAAVRGIAAVADQLAEQQVAVLLLSADVAAAALPGVSYRIGSQPTEFLIDEDEGTEVPLADGLVWAALHQDAIIVQLPDRTGPLAGEPAAALLRRGPSRKRPGPVTASSRSSTVRTGRASRPMAACGAKHGTVRLL
jgi:hypothetical protein